ncbi:hypothetical protein CHELA17_64073 [Chelatococcus asaccharovorans]|nr:hypothetical protein CHELA17_64073 [Chelatococcus asaccharovorans]
MGLKPAIPGNQAKYQSPVEAFHASECR